MTRHRSVDTLAALLLLLLYLSVATAALLCGVQVWNGAEDCMQQNFTLQTPLSYLAGKARQSDSFHIDPFADGTQALAFDAEWEGEAYITRLYCYDGALYELFTPEDIVLAPADGTRLMEGGTMVFSNRDGMLCVDYTAQDGQTQSLLLAPKRGEVHP